MDSLYSRPVVDFFENLQAPLIGELVSSEAEDEVREQQIRLMLLEKRIEVKSFQSFYTLGTTNSCISFRKKSES